MAKQAELEAQALQIQQSQQLLELARQRAEAAGERTKALELEKSIAQEQESLMRVRLQLAQQYGSLTTAQLATLNQIYDQQRQATEELEDRLERVAALQKDSQDLAASLATKLGLAADAQDGIFRKILASNEPASAFRDAMGETASAMGDIVTGGNIAVAVMTLLNKWRPHR